LLFVSTNGDLREMASKPGNNISGDDLDGFLKIKPCVPVEGGASTLWLPGLPVVPFKRKQAMGQVRLRD
jgi:hypothetical protein